MADDLLLVERRGDGITVLTLDRPPMNALSHALLGAIADVAESLADDHALGAVVVTGGGPNFAAGADVSEFGGPTEAARVSGDFRRALDGIAAIPRPVIAAINGYALGGGLELAMACDLRVAAETAKVGQPEVLLGIIPGAGGTQRLARLVGPARTKDLVWSGRHVGAEEALAIGLVDRVAPADRLMDDALAWAGELAAGAVLAMGLAKRAVDEGLDGSLPAGLDLEQELFVEVFGSEDAREGVAAFLERPPRKATFRGR